ncbi:MAG TPA: cytochrome c biogenesis protein CcsA [Coriobacteriia bacterium]|jgi:cytochrome c-type biogenesis protein CcmF
MTSLGNLSLALATLSALISVGALWYGDRLGQKEGEGTTNVGYLATFGVLVFSTLSVLVLLFAFLTNNFQFEYVATNHTTDISNLRWLYQISGVWAGREGSLLFWEWLVACFAAFVAYKRLSVTDRLSNIALAVTNVIQVFFLAALFIATNNPFKVSPANWFDPTTGKLAIQAAMNPLLQHWAMILHPPTLFIGYAGLTIPFAFAMAALIVGDGSKKWVELSDRITVFAWLFLGVGIGLGAIWAYVVLGWGGYWAWDPVENASLLPWLTGVGLLHSFTMYRRREGFKLWAVWMSAVSFAAVVLATFITRSGVVESVHAFEKDPLSLYLFLTLMLGSIVAAGVGMFLRKDAFASAEEFESLTSRDAAYYFNNVLMFVAALIVALMTLSPALFGGMKWGAPTYNLIAHIVGIVYVSIMVVCPLLSWRRTEGAKFWAKFRTPLIAGTGLAAVMAVLWFTQLLPNAEAGMTAASAVPIDRMLWRPLSLVGLIVAAYAITMPIYLFWAGARARAASKGESFGGALYGIVTKARSQSGGYLAHLGVGIILVGLVGSAMFVQDYKGAVAKPGDTFKAGDYVMTYVSTDQKQLANGDQLTTAHFTAAENGRPVGGVAPAELFNAVAQQSTRNVAIVYEPLRDVFIVLEQVNQDGSLQLSAKVNPLISFTWLGFALLIAGTTVAVWPRRVAVAR